MRPEVEQELAHTLLVELLAYQFASPVRWIETQDVVFGGQRTERIVEIGPADTLGGMARRTLASKYDAYDAATSVQRQILCYNKDAKEIYYDVDPIEEDEPEQPTEQKASSTAAPAAQAPPSGTAAPAPAPSGGAPSSGGPAAAVADAPVTATEILRALIAQKLKKGLLEIPLNKAIKDLVGGKSTLQNEIVGDLGKEFGSTPEKPEDTPLDELGAGLQGTFNGQLGKQSASLIARLVSSKMPGGFNNAAIRKYLESQFGLASGRQDGVLLLALTLEPASRITSEPAAKAYFDDVAHKYAASAGITFAAAPAAGDGGGGGAGMMVDPAALEALTKDQRAFFKQQLEITAKYLKLDLRAGDKAFITSQESQAALQSQLDLWNIEHGDFYASGIEPSFDPLKARVYDSHWNWARQDALSMYFDIIFGRLTTIDRDIVSQCIRVMNRSNPVLVDFMQYHIDNCPAERGETYQLAKQLGQALIENCKEFLNVGPFYKDVGVPTGPQTTVDASGNINYQEVPRPSVRKLEHYVSDMAAGSSVTAYSNRSKVENDLKKVYNLMRKQHTVSQSSQLEFNNLYRDLLRSLSMNENQILHDKKRGTQKPSRNKPGKVETIPFLHLKRKSDLGDWEYSKRLSKIYLDILETTAKDGLTFKDKNILMTGAGAGSIGAAVLQGLLSGGAKIVVTTSRFSREVTEYYQTMYTKFGARGSQMVVVPFNQGSKQDCENLVNYVYNDPKQGGLGWDLDAVIPFAAISENGREIDSIDSKSEFAHRLMLTNILRLLGSVKAQKEARGFATRPAQVILPLSPNHGTFGNDGLYSESKLGLETLFNRWHSESWANYLTICGAVIGWTRSTGLMNANDTIAQGVEELGVRTFSQQEMAFNIIGLMAPEVADLCQNEPVFADLNGGLQFIPDLNNVMKQKRNQIQENREIRRAVNQEIARDNQAVNGESGAFFRKQMVEPRANIKYEFPPLPDWKSEIEPLNENLKGMVNLDRVVVATGFSEVGPWGNARTRWEMEAYGTFSLEGCIEMAWLMGLIKHHNGPLKGKPYSGWVDTKTGEAVNDKDVKAKYEKHILEHSGIRLIEPELFNGYDPSNKQLLQEVMVEADLEPFETSKENAEEFRKAHGERVEIFETESGDYTVRVLKGATLMIPKALRFDRFVAGQVPTGWNAKQYGIPDDIISQVDPITLYVLVCVVEALLAAGVTDPYEFYKYVHVSEVGNCVGSGIGGTSALRGIYKDRYLDKPVQKDILQESFINTMSAWVNMLLLSSSGPIKTPVAACATAVESVDVGCETIMEGKARVCLVGGFDDFQEEGSYEFANMKATSNAEEEMAHGRTPAEMSRPTTTTRSGFMESQGCGIQLLMTAQLALDMGVPIHGIIGMSATASDKIGRSVPAPGKGILTTARESGSTFPSPLLDIKYRRRQLNIRRAQIKQWQESELLYLSEEVEAIKSARSVGDAPFDDAVYLQERVDHIEHDAKRQEKEAQFSLGNNFWKQDSRIAPLRGALATWGLTIDDLDVASFHGTSTVANDKNECDVICRQLDHLGRSKGNALLGIFQKYLTGHTKGAAGAFMMNGCLQVLNTGLVPGNRNADNVDKAMEAFEHVVYPSRSIQTDGIKAFSVTSFGFGQKGTQVIGIHPRYLFATLDEATFNDYRVKVESRQKKAYRYFHNGIINNSLFVAKDKPPYTPELEPGVYLNPDVRIGSNKKTEELAFASAASPPKPASDKSAKNIEATRQMVESLAKATAASSSSQSSSRVGVDVEDVEALNIGNETFLERNFAASEQEYCAAAASPQSSFAGRWSAKEAVFKALGVKSQGGGAPLKDIVISSDGNGAPVVTLNGAAAAEAEKAGVKSVSVSISHTDNQAVAVAVAHV